MTTTPRDDEAAASVAAAEAAITPVQLVEHAALRRAYDRALATSNRSPVPTDAEAAAVDDTYDALVDWVEANDLTYTSLDPRGGYDFREQDDAALRGER